MHAALAILMNQSTYLAAPIVLKIAQNDSIIQILRSSYWFVYLRPTRRLYRGLVSTTPTVKRKGT